MTTNFDLACAVEAANMAHYRAVVALRGVAPDLGTEDELTDRCVTCHGHAAWFLEAGVVRWGDGDTNDGGAWFDEPVDKTTPCPRRDSGGLVAVYTPGGIEIFEAADEVPPRAISFRDGTTTWTRDTLR